MAIGDQNRNYFQNGNCDNFGKGTANILTRPKITELEKVSAAIHSDTDPILIMANVTAQNGFENEGINKYADLVAPEDEDGGRQLMEHDVDGLPNRARPSFMG